MSNSSNSSKNLLLTGVPGCGKTTVAKRLAELLAGLRLAGFLTLELREHGQRVGFQAVGLGGRRAILAHVRFRTLVSVGRYGVEPERLLPLIGEELERPPGIVDAFLIDEIGKMECNCPEFVAAMRRLLDGPIPVVATIALRGGGFIAEVKGRPDVQLVQVTHDNREGLPGQIAEWLTAAGDRAIWNVARRSPLSRAEVALDTARDDPDVFRHQVIRDGRAPDRALAAAWTQGFIGPRQMTFAPMPRPLVPTFTG